MKHCFKSYNKSDEKNNVWGEVSMGRFCKIVLVFMLANMVMVLWPMSARGDPSELPQVSLQPSAITVWEGETFSLNVAINNLDASFEMYGLSLVSKFGYPWWSVLELESVEEGPFLRQFPTPPYTSENCTWFISFIESGGAWVMGMLLYPAADPSIPNPVFPEGNGTLATLTFTARVQGTTAIAFWGRLVGNSSAPIEVSYDLYATIEVKHRNGDLNGDGLVDVKDIAMVGKAFGSGPSDANWMIQADMNQDSMIDIRDVALIAKNFGKTFS